VERQLLAKDDAAGCESRHRQAEIPNRINPFFPDGVAGNIEGEFFCLLQPIEFSSGSVEVESVDLGAFQIEAHVFHALSTGELSEEGRKVVRLHFVETQIEVQRT